MLSVSLANVVMESLNEDSLPNFPLFPLSIVPLFDSLMSNKLFSYTFIEFSLFLLILSYASRYPCFHD